MTFDKNDPRISAYILGELDAKEHADFEKQLSIDKELATFVDRLKKTGSTLTTELNAEARDMGLSAAQRHSILSQSTEPKKSFWEKLNSSFSSQKMMITAATVVPVLLVALLLSQFFKQPPTASQASQPVVATSEYYFPPIPGLPSPKEISQNAPPPAPVELEQQPKVAAATAPVPAPTSSIASSKATFGVVVDSSLSMAGAPEGSYASDGYLSGNIRDYNTNYRAKDKNYASSDAYMGGMDQLRKSPPPAPPSNESYLQKPENDWIFATQEPLSTFSIDVDTASYSNIRRFLSQGQLPPPDAVRIEELLNYFTYDYPQPEGKYPFSVTTEIATCPWDTEHQLLRIGIKGKDITEKERPQLSLVFLIDVSGSMGDTNKLPLVISGMKLLVQKLRPNDRVAIVTYAGESRLLLASTPVSEKEQIIAAIESLRAGGSTNGEGGIKKAYQVARENFIENGANRVILCTDGDFNVGNTGEESLSDMVQRQAKSGVFLNVYGFGMGNYKDSRLVQLADKGNGVYGYIDSYAEAQKIFSKQILGTLVTIAKDVKIQVDFNPAKVGAYRLIGYEKRLLNKEDFKDDKKDAGEIGSGHTVTALYEIVPPNGKISNRVDASKYSSVKEENKELKIKNEYSNEFGTVRLRYKLPKADSSIPFDVVIANNVADYRKASVDFKLAAATAAFGMTLKDSPEHGNADLSMTLQLAKMGKGNDEDGYRAEFIRLIETAKELRGNL